MGLTSLRSSSSNKELSKSVKRKLDKKLNFLSKVRDTATSLGARKAISKKKKLRSRQKKLKAYDFSKLYEFLPDVDTSNKRPQETNLKLNCKSRQKLVEKEGAKLKTVLNHPVFQSDPLAAIHLHLQSTQPPSVTTPQEKKSGKKDKKKGKKKRSKALLGTQSMEI